MIMLHTWPCCHRRINMLGTVCKSVTSLVGSIQQPTIRKQIIKLQRLELQFRKRYRFEDFICKPSICISVKNRGTTADQLIDRQTERQTAMCVLKEKNGPVPVREEETWIMHGCQDFGSPHQTQQCAAKVLEISRHSSFCRNALI